MSPRTGVDVMLGVLLIGLTVLVSRGATDRVDLAVFRTLLPYRTGGAAQVADLVVALAQPAAVAVATVSFAVLRAARDGSISPLRVLVPPVVVVVVAVVVVKAVLHRAGPPGTHALGLLGYYPSGHTATSLVCAGAVARWVSLRRPGRRGAAVAVAATWTGVVGSSMVLPGYHWLTDVLGAVLAGVLILRLLDRLR